LTLQIKRIEQKIKRISRIASGLTAITGILGFSGLICAAFLSPAIAKGIFFDAVWITMFMMVIGLAAVKTIGGKK
jgi:hypothetical protein